jgi:alcohol dehydrogenase, propanol-preferring
MKAMVFRSAGRPLGLESLPDPEPGDGQVLVRVRACAVCRTDLHIVDGELDRPKLPLVPGHQIVGAVERVGNGVDSFAPSMLVGIPWLGWTCGSCRFCLRGRENLCTSARFTGYDIDGGYAELAVADARFCFPIPDGYTPDEASPLLCAGLIGFRSLGMCGDAKTIGFYGFGAAAHVIAQIAIHQGREIFAFTREGDTRGQDFARGLGVAWAGASTESPPEPLDAAIIFAPVGPLVPAALRATDRGGTVVCAGIHMSDIPSFPYSILWNERTIRSVANLTRRDGELFFEALKDVRIRSRVNLYRLDGANDALSDLRAGRIDGAAVLKIG